MDLELELGVVLLPPNLSGSLELELGVTPPNCTLTKLLLVV